MVGTLPNSSPLSGLPLAPNTLRKKSNLRDVYARISSPRCSYFDWNWKDKSEVAKTAKGLVDYCLLFVENKNTMKFDIDLHFAQQRIRNPNGFFV